MLTPARVRGPAIVAYAFGAAATFDGATLLAALSLGTAMVTLSNPWLAPRERPRYRPKHRRWGRVRVLAATNNEAAGRTIMRAQAVDLMASGTSGQLVLVDVQMGRPITRQVLDPRPPSLSEGDAHGERAPS
jgi:hypothetical protein